jgi:hypothetical protein
MAYNQLKGAIVNTTRPAFLAYLATSDNNVTGDGTAFTLGSVTALTEVFDQGNNFNTNGTFTAPVTGKYFLEMHALVTGATVATQITLNIVTSNRTYSVQTARPAGNGNLGADLCSLCDMDAGDTATFQVATSGEAGKTDDVLGDAPLLTSVSGYQVC